MYHAIATIENRGTLPASLAAREASRVGDGPDLEKAGQSALSAM
jgi:hypothetical protein